MKLLKPSWVTHDDKPIFSVDIHPAGKRFATGGQGGDSGRVVVWNLNSVLYESVEVDPNIPKMLCQMDNHLACVNCVRWSNNGRYLASGGDDRLVMVWGLSVATGNIGKQGKAETWRCVATLRGHAGDVLDLAWSPLDRWLASCSVDNTIIVWNAEKFPEMVCVLNGHTGLVKGVAWDPVGKYLASQSDDKSLRVWKTADWAPETVITEPFEECGGTTHVLRLSWSPDGQYVLSAHAMNGGGPTAQVVERDGWRCDKDFVGHRKAVTCARFNSNIMVKDGKKCCCAAVGSRDRALSIWLTSLKRPLVVIHELFADSVLDLSWSADGLNLLACSSDGTVACIQFTNREIGSPLTQDEKNSFYEKIYGKCLASEAGDLSSNLLIEGPEVLRARERQDPKREATESTPKSDKSQSKPVLTPSPVSSAATPLRPVDRQIETRTSDGKRRITPVFIPLTQADANESLGSQPGGAENCFSTSSQSKSRIRVERRDDIVIHPNVSNHATTPAAAPATATVTKETDNSLDQRLRKRRAPRLPGPRLEELLRKKPCPVEQPTGTPSLPVPALGTLGPVVRTAGELRLQVVNKACNTHYGPLSKIQLLQGNSVSVEAVWETYLGSHVTCITCDEKWACVACADGSLHAWRIVRSHAERVLPPLVLAAPAAKLTLTFDSLTAVTTTADLTVWDLNTARCIISPLSFRSLLSHGVTLGLCTLLNDGSPLISLSIGRSYVYCKKLCSWVVWTNSYDPVWRACRGHAATRPPQPSHHLYPREKTARDTTTAYNSSAHSSGATQSWLESQVASCLHLKLGKEYRHWFVALFGHLINHGSEAQIRSILDDMLGPMQLCSRLTNQKWEPTVLGINKHDMLEEMLGLLVRQLRWQRLYTEYMYQLDEIKESIEIGLRPELIIFDGNGTDIKAQVSTTSTVTRPQTTISNGITINSTNNKAQISTTSTVTRPQNVISNDKRLNYTDNMAQTSTSFTTINDKIKIDQDNIVIDLDQASNSNDKIDQDNVGQGTSSSMKVELVQVSGINDNMDQATGKNDKDQTSNVNDKIDQAGNVNDKIDQAGNGNDKMDQASAVNDKMDQASDKTGQDSDMNDQANQDSTVNDNLDQALNVH